MQSCAMQVNNYLATITVQTGKASFLPAFAQHLAEENCNVTQRPAQNWPFAACMNISVDHLQVFALFVKAPPKKFEQQEQQLRTIQQSFR